MVLVESLQVFTLELLEQSLIKSDSLIEQSLNVKQLSILFLPKKTMEITVAATTLMTLLSTIGAGQAAGEVVVGDEKRSSHLDIHPMTPNPKPYKITYDDGTESPWIQIKMRGGDIDSFSSTLIWEETLEGFTVGLSSTEQRGMKYYTYRDVNLKTGDLVRSLS